MIRSLHSTARTHSCMPGALLLAIAFIALPSLLHAQWSKVSAPSIAGTYFWGIDFESATVGYAIGSKASAINLYKTTDAGATWSVLKGLGVVPYTFTFIDEMTGFAAGRSNGCKCMAIARTTDGGATWKLDSVRNQQGTIDQTAAGYGINAITFADDMTGYAAGPAGALVRTTDRGATWRTLSTGNTSDNLALFSTAVARTGYGVAVTPDSRIALYRTADSGITWQRIPDFIGVSISDMQFITAETGFIVGNDGHGAIYKTTDGGATWSSRHSVGDSAAFITRIGFEDASIGYAVGSEGIVLRTTDGGESWTQEVSGSGDLLQGITIFDHTAYVVSTGGTLLKRTPGASGVKRERPASESILVMPNPFTTAATVRHADLRASGGELVLYDELGREARRIKAPAGMESFQFERAGLASGAYLYRLISSANGDLLGQGTVVVR